MGRKEVRVGGDFAYRARGIKIVKSAVGKHGIMERISMKES